MHGPKHRTRKTETTATVHLAKVLPCIDNTLIHDRYRARASASRGAVYLYPNLLELMDGSTSSRVATDYH